MNAERHLTSEELDLLELDALSGDERLFAQTHLAGCERCGARREELRADTAHFRQFVMPRTLETVTRTRRSRRPWTRWGSALAGAAVLALALLVARPMVQDLREDEARYVGVRGEPTFKVVAARGNSQAEVTGEEPLREGDRLRFVVDPVQPGYVLVVSRDPAGAWSVYAPFAGGRSVAVPAGTTTLPEAVELDATRGREDLVAVFSDAPLEARDVIAALAQSQWPLASRPVVPGARSIQVVSFDKR